MVDWMLYLVLVAFLLTGLFLTVLTLPGLWLMLASTALYAWVTHWRFAGFKTLIVLLLLAAAAEAYEFFAAGAGAKKAGATKRGMIGAMIGGIVGAIFLTVPFPVVGTLIGACIGTFIGALIAELTAGTEVDRSFKVGSSAAAGRLIGTIGKLAFGFVMLLITLWAALPIGARKAALPTTAPAMTRTA